MKISELHSLIGRPAFNIGDRVRIKKNEIVGWIYEVTIDHYAEQYKFTLLSDNDDYLGSRGGWTSDELEFADHAEAMDEPCAYLKDSENGWDLIDEAKQQAIS